MKTNLASASDAFTRVKSLSRWLKHLTTAGMITFIGFSLSVVIVPDWFDTMVRLAFQDIPAPTGITPVKRFGLILLFAAPLGVALLGLWNIRALFHCYAGGEVFSEKPARHIRWAGLAMIVNAVLTMVTYSLGSLVLTYDNPAGQKQFAVALSSDLFFVFLTGGLLMVIGQVLREAFRISAENRQFV